MQRVRWYRRWRTWAVLVALGLLILVLAHGPILRGLAELPVLEEPLERSDLIVVFSGDLPDVHYGVDLYLQGYGSRMLFIGNFPVALQVSDGEPFDVVEKPWYEVAARLAVGAGVSPKDLLFSEAFNTSTYERVESAFEVVRLHKVKSVILVSDSMHSRRIKWCSETILRGESLKVIVSPTPQRYFPEAYRFDADNWWKDERQIGIVIGAWTRLVYYWLLYGSW